MRDDDSHLPAALAGALLALLLLVAAFVSTPASAAAGSQSVRSAASAVR